MKGLIMTSKMKSGKPGMLKKINRGLILKLLLKEKAISRSKLAKATGLALPSVMRLVDDLMAEGLVLEIGKGSSTGGRKPAMLTLNPDVMYFIGVEIAIDTQVVLTNMLGQVLGSRKTKQMAFSKPEEILTEIVGFVKELLEEHKIDPLKLAGIGIGTPGSQFKHIRDIDYSILKGWESIDVKAWLTEKLPYEIVVDNIARTRTLSELWFGHGKEYDDFIYVFVDQGVGCGIVNAKKILTGYDSVAGEFGHSIVTYQGRPCYCGREGCLEMYVSAGAILSQINKKYELKIQSPEAIHHLSDYKEVYEEVVHYLGIGIGNLINIINPEAIILGGEVINSYPELIEPLRDIIRSYTFNQKALNTKVLKANNLSEDINLGGMALIFNHIFE